MTTSFIGKVLDNYRILENLGIGGMGVVFKAIHIKLDKVLALKMIAPGLAMNENFIDRFQKEAKALAKLEDPNIVRIYDLRSDNDRWFIVMEYVDGSNLSDKLKKDGAFHWKDALHLIKQVLSAIGHAHSSGILHRDLKPNNIMITADNRAKITDFGLAKDQNSIVGTITVASGGTLYYMSPEHVKGIGFTDNRSDIYSIGMTLYEMVTGHVPFEGLETDFDIREAIIRRQLVKPSKFNDALPADLEMIIMKAINKDPEKRYQSAEEMLDDISTLEWRYAAEHPGFKEEKYKRKKISKRKRSAAINKTKRILNNKLFRFTVVISVLMLILIFLFNIATNIPDMGKVTNQGKLSLDGQPLKALVYLDNRSIGETPIIEYPLKAGNYQLRLVKENYRTLDSTITIMADSILSMAYSLYPVVKSETVELAPVAAKSSKKQKTSIPLASALISSIPSGAYVFIDGRAQGKTPLQIYDLSAGRHWVQISKEGFEPYRREIHFKADQSERISVKLRSVGGIITIQTDPPGANISVDGREIEDSQTPMELNDLLPGEYALLIHKNGFAPLSKRIVIEQNQTIEVRETLIPLMGTLSIQVRPWGTIYLNKELQKSSTDVKYEIELPVDRYEVKVVHPTLGTWIRMIDIKAKQNSDLNVNFNQRYPVRISAFDENGQSVKGTIYLDGENIRQLTPAELRLRTGLHRILVRKEGFIASSGEQEIVADDEFNGEIQFIMARTDQ